MRIGDYEIPLMELEYLQRNNLWDSSWLEVKYPNKFKTKYITKNITKKNVDKLLKSI